MQKRSSRKFSVAEIVFWAAFLHGLSHSLARLSPTSIPRLARNIPPEFAWGLSWGSLEVSKSKAWWPSDRPYYYEPILVVNNMDAPSRAARAHLGATDWHWAE